MIDYIFVTDSFESSSLALTMSKIEGKSVKVVLKNKECMPILDGIMDKTLDPYQFIGKKNIWIFDDATSGSEADSLRALGETVFGGSKTSDRLENERSYGHQVMKEVGLNVSTSKNFKGPKAFDEAIAFIQGNKRKWVVKQNGEQDKSLSTVGKFDDGTDVIDRLMDMKHIWTQDIDFDLQECVDGYECAIEGWFNGKDWVRDTKGEPVFLINFEHKKKSDGDTGRTTGETGTLAYRSSKGSLLNKELLKMTDYLKKIKYIGNIDINFILSEKDKKPYCLEFTNRFGYPMINLQQEMFKTPWHKLLYGCATGQNNFFEVDPRWAVVIVVQVPPFPFASVKDEGNAKGQRIYFLDNGKWTGKDSFTIAKLKHLHPYEVRYEKETKHYICSGDTGYLMTVTAQGDSIEQANNKALDYIKNNIMTNNMDYRKDIGINSRVTKAIQFMKSNGYL